MDVTTAPAELRLGVLAIVVLLLLLLGACKPPEPRNAGSSGGTEAGAAGLQLRVEFETLSVGPSPVTVHVLDGSQGVENATVEVQADMSHAGMQPVIVTAAQQAAGVYRADDFVFSMAGDWIVTASVETEDGVSAKLETFLSVSSR